MFWFLYIILTICFEHNFAPANEPPNVISRIIKQKYDEPSSTWKKVRLELRDRWFGEFKVIWVMIIVPIR